jgi:hypothetical protein
MKYQLDDLLIEVQQEYIFNLKKSILDYALLDPEEKIRLSITIDFDKHIPKS